MGRPDAFLGKVSARRLRSSRGWRRHRLAVTGAGGDVLFVEATASEGEPGLTLTGQLGDVMKESAQIALSYVRSHAAALGVARAAPMRPPVDPADRWRRTGQSPVIRTWTRR